MAGVAVLEKSRRSWLRAPAERNRFLRGTQNLPKRGSKVFIEQIGARQCRVHAQNQRCLGCISS